MLFRSLPFLSLVATALSVLAITPVLGQTLPSSISPGDMVLPQQPQSYSIIHVNSVSGSDTSGDGSQLRPWQTITQALRRAEPNSVIILAPGVYSEDSGESFPIRLKPGVTVQGSATPGINNAVIRGSGTFPSASGAYMQVTIVGADGAGLAHVTVTNSSTSGYGLVVESGSPIIRENHFIGSGYAGAYAAGTGSPLFEQNYFSENGSVGLVIAGQSRADVQGNMFENTGTGIQVEPGAQPTIANNRIVSNRAGLVVAANARPQLHNNEIFQNRHNGLIEFTAANKTEPSSTPLALGAPLPLRAAEGGVSSTSAVLSAPMVQFPEVGQPSLEPPPQVNHQAQNIAPPPVANRSAEQLASPPAVSVSDEALATVPGEPTDNQPANLVLLSPPSESPGLTAQPPEGQLATAVGSTTGAASEVGQTAARGQDLPFSLPLATALDSLDVSQIRAVTSDGQTTAAETVAAIGATDAEEDTATVSEPSTDGVLVREISEEGNTSASETVNTTGDSNSAIPEIARAAEADSPLTSEIAPAATEPTASEISDRQTGLGRSNSEASETAVPLQVIPPSTETLVRGRGGPAEEDSLVLTESSVTNPEERADRLPALPPVDPNSADLLQVPDMTIPAGNGRHNVPVLATGSANAGMTVAMTADGPPAPPSRAAMLGLLYRVLVSSPNEAVQSRVRDLVPDAFRVEYEGDMMMQAGAYPTQEEAKATVERLQQQGLDAQVIYIP